MKEKIFLEQDSQSMYNIIDALQFYKDNAVRPKYRHLIDKQLENVIAQLELQNIAIYKKDNIPLLIFGEKIKYEDKEAVVVQTSDEDGFIKIAIPDGDKINIVDVPITLIKKE